MKTLPGLALILLCSDAWATPKDRFESVFAQAEAIAQSAQEASLCKQKLEPFREMMAEQYKSVESYAFFPENKDLLFLKCPIRPYAVSVKRCDLKTGEYELVLVYSALSERYDSPGHYLITEATVYRHKWRTWDERVVRRGNLGKWRFRESSKAVPGTRSSGSAAGVRPAQADIYKAVWYTKDMTTAAAPLHNSRFTCRVTEEHKLAFPKSFFP
ncbi:MAG: hypothetical protein HY921_06190 [Elusimicrobia bacterium]|nr:hypothetical protein [Elusimicrobiota bacterium]